MKTVLYLGLEPPEQNTNEHLIHFPVINIVPRPRDAPEIRVAYDSMSQYTHLIFTSKSAVRIFFKYLPFYGKIEDLKKKIVVVGQATAREVEKHGTAVWKTATDETAEGLIAILDEESALLNNFFWPHSALSRAVIADYLTHRKCRWTGCVFYDTEIGNSAPPPSLRGIDEIVFTSPSTVEGFIKVFDDFPEKVILRAIGPVTREKLIETGLLQN